MVVAVAAVPVAAEAVQAVQWAAEAVPAVHSVQDTQAVVQAEVQAEAIVVSLQVAIHLWEAALEVQAVRDTTIHRHHLADITTIIMEDADIIMMVIMCIIILPVADALLYLQYL